MCPTSNLNFEIINFVFREQCEGAHDEIKKIEINNFAGGAFSVGASAKYIISKLKFRRRGDVYVWQVNIN